MPIVEQGHSGLVGGEFAGTGSTGGNVGTRGCIAGRSGVQQQIGKIFLAGCAVHRFAKHNILPFSSSTRLVTVLRVLQSEATGLAGSANLIFKST
jgi:hypothetical protein